MRLKSGEYDDVHIMHAWLAIDELIKLKEAIIANEPLNHGNATGARCVCPLCRQPHDPKLISSDGPLTDGHR